MVRRYELEYANALGCSGERLAACLSLIWVEEPSESVLDMTASPSTAGGSVQLYMTTHWSVKSSWSHLGHKPKVSHPCFTPAREGLHWPEFGAEIVRRISPQLPTTLGAPLTVPSLSATFSCATSHAYGKSASGIAPPSQARYDRNLPVEGDRKMYRP